MASSSDMVCGSPVLEEKLEEFDFHGICVMDVGRQTSFRDPLNLINSSASGYFTAPYG